MWVENELKLSLYTSAQKDLLARVDKLERRSMIDTVTGCWSRRGMDALLDKEISRSRRQHSPVALLLVDVEKSLMAETKRVTGSSADMIIKETAQRIRRCVRDHDIVGRISNTRFLVCLTNCTIEMCSVLTQRILRTIAIEPLKLEAGTIRLSALIGCTSNEGTDVWSSTRLQDTVLQALGEAGKGNKTNNFYLVKPQI